MTLEEFLNQDNNKELLDNNEFEKLYERADEYRGSCMVAQLTEYIFNREIKINPLDYMKEVPVMYLFNRRNIKRVNVPEGITTINKSAFAMCQDLEKICLPSSLKEIQDDAFGDDLKLSVIYYNGTKKDWYNIKSYPNMLYGHLFGATVYCADGKIKLSY